jgi:hypothetical protein
MPPEGPEYPYVLSARFLSPAGHNFFSVLNPTVGDRVVISIRTRLGDLFVLKSKDTHRLE